MSNFWTGSTSDRRITQESGFLDKLEEGDEVMADKGFNISDFVIVRKATLNTPPLAKGKLKCIFIILGVNSIEMLLFKQNGCL